MLLYINIDQSILIKMYNCHGEVIEQGILNYWETVEKFNSCFNFRPAYRIVRNLFDNWMQIKEINIQSAKYLCDLLH